MSVLRKLLTHGPGLIKRLPQAWRVYRRAGWRGVDWEMRRRTRPQNDYGRWVQTYDMLDDAACQRIRAQVDAMVAPPRISVLMPCYNPDPRWLRAAVASVQAQLYPHWELCIADDASPDPAVREALQQMAAADARIRLVLRERNGHISEASNSALDAVTAPWIALMDHDDLLPADALFEVARCIEAHPQARLIYSDEDKVDDAGVRSDPYFKPDWNPDLFRSHNMFSHLGVLHTGLVREVGGFRKGLEGSQDWDLVLRCVERVEPAQIVHIPRVLYHWRIHAQSTASSMDAKPYAVVAGERALNEHLARTGVRGQAEHVGIGYRVRYALPDVPPKVSIIIPTRNAQALVRQCIHSIERRSSYPDWEILLVDNGSDDPAAVASFAQLAQNNPRIRVLRDDRPFNYSALNNAAAAQAQGQVLALVNNDIEVLSSDWLEEMVSLALQPGVGAVGARLWFPNRTLQHAGVLLGPGGLAAHANRGLPRGLNGYAGRAALLQGFSAVTAACLVVRKALYDQVGGLDEDVFAVAYNDVDFCLRLREAGYRNIWTPYAELIHHESATRGTDVKAQPSERFERERTAMFARWQSLIDHDPAYNPNLRLDAEDMGLAWPPRRPAP
ncbi:glycosyltransferase family 2 protein [Xenophilus arseniciresistens]|uniref:Glycosyltransferase family 2 protein n=1 Tax=Xenophilus arseniciresistens TaxID=1283306 RepID=A0AAE3N9T0_9BURK|nr:glycosyltransferase family 2 protein [Xenophilus arseniciresistens]MDA7417781.1 glycosyltransferase family 2 protein [Xenophilus arseniciresistens]